MKISTVEQMRNLDKSAIENFGITQEFLMENAGEAVYFVILQEYGVKNKKFVLFCGIGNNGGDGLVVARKIHSTGGDGITAISVDIKLIKERQSPTILTPHPGEMARIAHVTVNEVLENRISLVQKEAKSLNAYIVLKGAHSLIGYPDEMVFVNVSGNSGMATAGSGDVLTGTIAAMYGLGLCLEDAVRTGVFLHGFSGDLAAEEKGEDGITAQDILDYLPFALKRYRDEYDEVVAHFYKSLYVV